MVPMHRHSFTLRPLAAGLQLAFVSAAAVAAPGGGNVVAGQATIAQQGSTTQVKQASQRAVVNWQSFNVGPAEAVVFNQPNSSAAILNRVAGDASQILGRMSANGQVYLVNPNGIVFGRTAQVDVGSLLATTSNISNSDFMAGRLRFTEAGQPGAVVRNEGRITVAQGGFAALVAPGAANAGVIVARLGKVSLAAGEAFVLDLRGDSLVNIVVDPASMRSLTDVNGRPLGAFVDHSGAIVADGGRVQLAAATVKQLLDNVINVSGTVRVTTVDERAGVISLRGDEATRVSVAGSLEAAGSRGGTIEITGGHVVLGPTAKIGVTGSDGGGSVFVGGGWHGSGPLAHAARVDVAPGARIDASASASGNAGTVVVWSDASTVFDGAIAARGGPGGGRGGNVEVSSKGALGFSGSVDVHSTDGHHGSLLLDPTDLVVDAGASGGSTVSAAELGFLLSRGANINLQASHNVTVNQLIDGRGGVAGGNLGLTAGNDLTLNNSIVLKDGALQLTAAEGQLRSVGNARLDVGAGSMALQGGGGVTLKQISAGGAISIGSAHGGVTVTEPIAGPAGAAASSLSIDAAGSVRLAGARTRGGGLALTSRSGDVVSVEAAGSGGGLVSEGRAEIVAGASAGTELEPLDVQAGANGGISIEGAGGVHARALVTPGTVTLRSLQGPVTVTKAIAGSAGSLVASADPVAGVTVATDGPVRLAGITAGDQGVLVTGYRAASSASSFELSGASITSAGPVDIRTSGPIRLVAGASVVAGGSVSLASTSGSITLGLADVGETGGIRVKSAGSNVTLKAGADIELNADVEVMAGTIAITSTGGAITARVAQPGGELAREDAAIDAGRDADRSRIIVRAPGTITLGALRAQSLIDIESSASNVVLLKSLGGSQTGYLDFAHGYQDQATPDVGQDRATPDVGRLLVSAPAGSVELNGLNLDGNASPFSTDDGLRVTAGKFVLSNETIAVNKGHILLSGGTAQANYGVYLGGSVFSRGWDSVGADRRRGTADDVKIGYRIRIEGANLGLFDNTTEFASIPGLYAVKISGDAVATPPRITDEQGFLVDSAGERTTPLSRVHYDATDNKVRVVAVDNNGNFLNSADVKPGCPSPCPVQAVLGVSVLRNIAKIEIANNVANYQDADSPDLKPERQLSSLLVPSTNDPAANTITVATNTVSGVGGSGPSGDTAHAGRLSLSGFDPTPIQMSQTVVATSGSPGDHPILGSTRGIGLKLLGFEVVGDHSTVIWSDDIGFVREGSASGEHFFANLGGSVTPSTPPQPPLNGYFYVRFKDQFEPVPNSQNISPQQKFDAVFKLQIVSQDPLSATVVAVQATTSAGDAVSLAGLQFVDLDKSLIPVVDRPLPRTNLRLVGKVVIGRYGNAAALTVAAVPLGDMPSGSPVLSKFPLPSYRQRQDGEVIQPSAASSGYGLKGAAVDSSTNGSFDDNQRGTRLFVFDSSIDTQSGQGVSDTTNGAWVPGFSGIKGNNNSTTGLPSVGPGFGALLGASGLITVGPSASSDLPRAILMSPVVADRATQDADTPRSGLNLTEGGEGIVIGGRPSIQADLGRSGSASGAAIDVFRQRFQMATSGDSSVCNPDAIQPAEGRSRDTQVRDCQAAQKQR
jgi:filamentous hemagglutinin family protein